MNNLTTFQFADDIMLVATSEEEPVELANRIHPLLQAVDVEINDDEFKKRSNDNVLREGYGHISIISGMSFRVFGAHQFHKYLGEYIYIYRYVYTNGVPVATRRGGEQGPLAPVQGQLSRIFGFTWGCFWGAIAMIST